MGTPEFAVPSLRAVARTCEVVAVVSRPDQPRGRGQLVAESAVARLAAGLGVPRLKPEVANDAEVVKALRDLSPDLFAVVAFGAILSPDLLRVPRLGSVNLHGSLLPEYRGASPVQRALWEGRSGTGVTTLWMDEGVDTGDLILQRWEPIAAEDDAGSLAGRLAELGGPLLAETLQLAAEGQAPRRPQAAGSGSVARKLAKSDGIVDWTLDVEAVWNRQRAVSPWPGATTVLRGGRVLLTRSRPLHRLPVEAAPGTILGVEREGVVVACGLGALLVQMLKPEGKAARGGAEWARGARPHRGERFGLETAA